MPIVTTELTEREAEALVALQDHDEFRGEIVTALDALANSLPGTTELPPETIEERTFNNMKGFCLAVGLALLAGEALDRSLIQLFQDAGADPADESIDGEDVVALLNPEARAVAEAAVILLPLMKQVTAMNAYFHGQRDAILAALDGQE